MSYRSKLIDEPPVAALPSLIRAFGLRDAVVLQQIHYRTRALPSLTGQEHTATRKELSANTGLSIDQIKRATESLTKKGAIEVFELDDGRSGTSANHYEIDDDRIEELVGKHRSAKSPTERAESPRRVGGIAEPSYLPDDVPKGTKKRIEFEEYWSLYPKKLGRKRAEALWKKLDDEARRSAIDHIPIYAGRIDDPKFLKQGDTYLSQEPWRDEYPVLGIAPDVVERPVESKDRPEPCSACSDSGWIDDEGVAVRCSCVKVVA